MNIRIFNDIFENKIFDRKKIVIIESIFIIILFLIIFFNNNFYIYYNNSGEVKDNMIVTVVYAKDIDILIEGSEIIIDKEKYAYEIVSIDSDNYISNGSIFKVITLKLEDYSEIDNRYLDYKIIKEKETILSYFIKTMKGGQNLNNLTNEKLEKTTGGEITFLGGVAIVTGIVFLVGVIEGFVNPKKCGQEVQ